MSLPEPDYLFYEYKLLLIEVVTNAGLTVFNFFSNVDIERFNAQNWILTSAELKIQWLLNF